MDGVYQTNLKTPMGNMNIKIALKQTGEIINGMVELMGSKYPLSQGRVNNGKCYFQGELNNNMLSLKYNLIGELVGNILNINAKTNMGEFELKANKIK